MRKSTLFISAALSAFMLAILFGVVSAYQNITGPNRQAAVQPQPAAVLAAVSTPIPAQVSAQVNITPEAAAAVASKVLNRTDLYSVEVAQFEGVDAYLVTFSSGDLVYISMDGQVLSISKIAVTTIVQPAKNNGSQGNNSVSNGNAGGEHEGGEHEGGDD